MSWTDAGTATTQPQAAAALTHFEELFPSRRVLRISPHQADALYELPDDTSDGCDVMLEAGEFTLHRTIRIPSNTRIIGAGRDKTVLVLAPHSNCHLFTNSDHKLGNRNIFLGSFSVVGNADQQSRPADSKALTFCCAVYIKKLNSIICADLEFFDIRQTCLHFNGSVNVLVLDVVGRRMGWSGVSTSDASNMYVRGVFDEAGLDVIHSGIHIDGGVGVYVDAIVRNTVGNGIMLDSAYAPLRGCAVRGTVERCKRGVSLSGSAANALSDVVIQGRFCDNMDAGVMVSNADHVMLSSCEITANKGYGLLFQGRNGGNNCVVADCIIQGNGTDIGHLHASRENWVFPRSFDALSFLQASPNARAVLKQFGRGQGWFERR